MAGITLQIAQAKLALWLEAEEKVASGQAWSDGTRQLTRANLKEIQSQVTYWDLKVEKLTRRNTIRRITKIS